MQGCEDYFDLDENQTWSTTLPLATMLSTTTQKTGLNSQRVADITSYFVQYVANPAGLNRHI